MQKLRIVKLGLLLLKMVHAAFDAFVTFGKQAVLKTVSMIFKLRSTISNLIIASKGRKTFYGYSGESKKQLMSFIFDGYLCGIIETSAPLNLDSKVISEEGSSIQSLSGWVMSKFIVADEWWIELVSCSLMKFVEDSKRCLDSLRFTLLSERLGSRFDDTDELTNSYEEVKSHSEIPLDLYTSPEVVSRLLKKIKRQHSIAMGHWRIRFKEFTAETLNIPSKHLDYVL
ncbi:MAG: hypothetical protein OSA78_06060 [Flavobacteriales bacterium]|nr:hypothetical protein [Flavobacteriales bacterium]